MFWMVLSLSVILGGAGAPADDLASLEQAFQDPPLSARPRAFWPWLNGAVELPDLTRDLQEMKAKGMGGAEIWDCGAHRNPDGFVPTGPEFLGPESAEAIRHALKEAKALGLDMGIVTSSGWNAGGAWVKPEEASKNLYFSDWTVEGPQSIEQPLAFPEVPEHCPKGADGMPLYWREVRTVAFPEREDRKIESLEDIQDLSGQVREGVLCWNVPEGQWHVMRFVCTNNGQHLIVPSPNSNGLFIDFLDPEQTRKHFQYFLDRIGLTPETARESALSYFEVDSMELERGIVWNESFPSVFRESEGYDLLPWLPALAGWTIQDTQTTQQVWYDFRQALSDRLIFSHYTAGSALLAEYGMDLAGEAGGPGPPIWNTCPVDALKALGNVTIPRGEFWVRHRNMFLIKEVASAAHIYGKRYVDAESFTTWRRWKDSPFTLKRYVDRAFCEGLNRVTYHTFAHTPLDAGFPGRSYHAGSDINTATTWWEKSQPFHEYIARCCAMLQQGQFVADVCYYYGDQAPNFFPRFHDVPEKPRMDGLPAGFDYDVVNSDVLLNRMRVENGRIVLPNGMSYTLMLLANQPQMPLEVVEKISELVAQGAIIIGPKPSAVPGFLDNKSKSEELRREADALWDGGGVHSGVTAEDMLREMGVRPDFCYIPEGPDTTLDYIHRRVGDADVYFVRNKTLASLYASCTFRVSGKIPQLWHADTGRITEDLVFRVRDDRIEVRIPFDPGESVFVVFAPGTTKEEPPWTERGYWTQVAGVPGPWEVHFPEGWGAPRQATYDSLASWTDSEDEGIKYFSGTATYTNTITIPQELLEGDAPLYLDLGEVRDLAEVYLNDVPLGIVWKPPFRVDLSGAVRAGENALRVEVVNMWINRLTGDQLLPPEQRFTHTNDTDRKDLGGDEPWRIQASGLLGPVRLLRKN